MLDRRTAVRWGDDNLTWVVHYPDEFVDLWVKSEAARQRMRPDQEEAYRKSFTEELRTGAATTVMLSVHAFGQSPISIAPFSKNITLIDSSGRRLSPIAFEKRLDSPLSGLVQGFVFFPRQSDENFAIAVKGLISGKETIFSFAGDSARTASINTGPSGNGENPSSSSARETVVRIPTPKAPQPKRPEAPKPPVPEAPEFSSDAEVFPPTRPGPEPAPQADIKPEVPAAAPDTPRPAESPKLDARQVLELYLKAWMDGDADRMYSLLSSESQGRVSKDLFARDAMSESFRRGLKEGYKVDWSGGSAKVTVAKRMLFMRALDSRQIKFIEENGSARVSW
jgi:hypothetical protein